MGLKDGENLNVTCPCCQAKLVIDPVFGAVLSHTAPVKPGPDVDLTKASDILENQKKQREDKFGFVLPGDAQGRHSGQEVRRSDEEGQGRAGRKTDSRFRFGLKIVE